MGCLWTTEKRFGDTAQDDSQVVYHTILDQPKKILAMVGRVFIASADKKVRVYDISQRDAPILENTVDLDGEPIALLNYGEELVFVSDLSIQLRRLGTLGVVEQWDAPAPIIDAVWRPGGNNMLALLDTEPLSLQEFDISNNTLSAGLNWTLDIDETIIQIAAYSDGLTLSDQSGNIYHLTLEDNTLISTAPVAVPNTQSLHVTKHPYIIHATGNNGLRIYDTQLIERSVWPPLGETLATTSLDNTVYTTATGEFIVLDLDETGQVSELWRIPLEAEEKSSVLYVDRGFAYSIDTERGHFSIIDTIR